MNPPYGREIGLWVRKAAECGVTALSVAGADRYGVVSRLHIR